MGFHELPLSQKIVVFFFGLVIFFIFYLIVNSGSIIGGQKIVQEKGTISAGEVILLNQTIDTVNSKILVSYPEKVYPTVNGINPSYFWEYDITYKHLSGVESDIWTELILVGSDGANESIDRYYLSMTTGDEEKKSYYSRELVSRPICTRCGAKIVLDINAKDKNINNYVEMNPSSILLVAP
jgi:hypothetical protein